MIKRQDVTIIVPHFTSMTPEMEFAFEHCVESLEEIEPEIRRIVIKNGPHNDECKHEADIIINHQGQCQAVNCAVGITNNKWIMVTNDDMMYAPGWFDKLTNIPNDVVCVSPKLIEPRDGAPTFEKYFCGGAGGDYDKAKWLEFAKNYKGTGLRTGFNLPFLIRKDLWNMIDGYDINYDPWGSNSDSDLEYKIRLAGVQPMQNTDAIVYHFSQTSGTFGPQNNYYWGRNFQYFIDKWGFTRTDNGIWEANFEMPDKERIYRPRWEGKYEP